MDTIQHDDIWFPKGMEIKTEFKDKEEYLDHLKKYYAGVEERAFDKYIVEDLCFNEISVSNAGFHGRIN